MPRNHTINRACIGNLAFAYHRTRNMTDRNLTPEIFGDYDLHLENMKRTRTMTRAITQETIATIQRLGFSVYMITEFKRSPSWLVYTSDNRLAYLQVGYLGGFDISTLHKPCKHNGTGFRVHDNVSLTHENLLQGFEKPQWASGLNATQWESPKQYFESCPFKRQYRRVWYTVSDGQSLMFSRDYMGAISDALKLARGKNVPWEAVSVYDETGAFYDWIKGAEQLFNTNMGL